MCVHIKKPNTEIIIHDTKKPQCNDLIAINVMQT